MLDFTPIKFYIAITGKITYAKRAKIADILRQNGIGITDTISRSVRYLVQAPAWHQRGKSSSEKLDEARRLGVQIVDQDFLLDLLNMTVVNGRLVARAS